MFVTPAYAQTETPSGGTEAAPSDHATSDMHTETGVAGHEGGAHEGAFPPFDPASFASQLLWLAISFGLFYLVMKRVLVPRIGGILEHRRDRIAQDLGEAGRLKDEADNAIATYEQELATARSKAQEIAQTARDKAKAAADTERTKVEAELSKKMADAEANIASIKAKALAEVDAIATDTTTGLVEHLLGGSVTKADVAAAVRDVSGK